MLSGCLKNEKETVIFYSPHADDEVLSMGASIIQAVEKDKNVIVILLSKGLATQAFYKVNNKLKQEGKTALVLDEFGDARVNEFKASVKAMGIEDDNILVYNLPDGHFTIDIVKPILLKMEEKYPGAEHHVMTFKDPHPDHKATGDALRSLIEEQKINNGYFHIPIQEFDSISFTGKDELKKHQISVYKRALDIYGQWSPEEGKYAIGQTSVPDYFIIANKYLESRWHKLE